MATGQLFRIGPLGADMPLFNNPVSQGSDINSACTTRQRPRSAAPRVLHAGSSSRRWARSTTARAERGAVSERRPVEPLPDSDLQSFRRRRQLGQLAGARGIPMPACFDPELGRLALCNALDRRPPLVRYAHRARPLYYQALARTWVADPIPGPTVSSCNPRQRYFRFPIAAHRAIPRCKTP